MQNKLLISIPVLNSEIEERKKYFFKSIENMKNTGIENYEIIFVIQINDDEKSYSEVFQDFKNITILYSSIKSVSHARNLAINYAIENLFSHMIISDSSVIIGECFYRSIKYCMKNHIELMQGRIIWNIDTNVATKCEVDLKKQRLNILADSYVGNFLFKVERLDDVRFNETIGPASHTTIKAGEDMLFLYEYMLKNGDIADVNDKALVYHPPRDNNLSKHLIYASGQGALYKYFLFKKHKPRYFFIYFFLFWANSLKRVLFFRRNSLKILGKRLFGFFVLNINDTKKKDYS